MQTMCPAENTPGSGSASIDDSDAGVVLIVEDERDLADLYATFLQDTYTVKTAYTGEEALDLLDDTIDVVLLDRRLKNWTGSQLLGVIQERRLECQIAMVTAVIPDFDIAGLAIDEYVTKSVTREELLTLVEELLLRRESDITQQELLALISRKRVLENEKSDEELAASDEYAKLERRIEIATDRLNIDPQHISANKHRPESCPDCDLRWDVSIGNTVGFLKLGAYIWKCTGCGTTTKIPDPSNRRVTRS